MLLIDGPDVGEVNLYCSPFNSDYYTGRLEVFLSDVWGTVAGSWTKQNAAVVCRQMGFECELSIIFLEESIALKKIAPLHPCLVSNQSLVTVPVKL